MKRDTRFLVVGILFGILGNIVATCVWELGKTNPQITFTQGTYAVLAGLGVYLLYDHTHNPKNSILIKGRSFFHSFL